MNRDVLPISVLSAKVNNYQRFTREFKKRQIPYIVVGTGGRWHLHNTQKNSDGSVIKVPFKLPDSDVTLEKYNDKLHGYLILRVTSDSIMGNYYGIHSKQHSSNIDTFKLDLEQHKVTTYS